MTHQIDTHLYFFTTFGIFEDVPNSMTFYSSADVAVFFTNDFGNAVVTHATAGMCFWPYQWGEFNVAKKSIEYNLRENFGPNIDPYKKGYIFGSNSSSVWKGGSLLDMCPAQLPLHVLNNFEVWSASDISGTHTEEFDVNTIMQAMSLNMNVSSLDIYTPVAASYGSQSVGGVKGQFYISPLGVGVMEPVFCVDKKALQKTLKLTNSQVSSAIPICGFVHGPVDTPLFYYPIAVSVYNVYATSETFGQYKHCSCPTDNVNAKCQQRDFVVSLFYDLGGDILKSFQFGANMQKFLVDDPVNGDLTMQDFVTPFISSTLQLAPMFGGGTADLQPPTSPRYAFMHGTARETHQIEWFKICPWGTCAAVVVETYKGVENNEFLPLNAYNYEIAIDPSITDTFPFNTTAGKVIQLPRTM